MCGVAGVYAPGEPVAYLIHSMLEALQHRGQESAGMSVATEDGLRGALEMGLVNEALPETQWRFLDGDFAIGHTRYSTTGSSIWENAQPTIRASDGFALAHNGNLVSTKAMVDINLVDYEQVMESDTHLLADLLAEEMRPKQPDEKGLDLQSALLKVLPNIEGAFSLVILEQDRLFAVRDPKGFRPLCIGSLDGHWAIASETCALDMIGAQFEREVSPGEMVIVDSGGIRSIEYAPHKVTKPKLCSFEFVYFARPDSIINGQTVENVRQRLGEELGRQAPTEADMVIAVPESSVHAAEAYARVTGIPYGHGLVKNRYLGRTFISPNQATRQRAVVRKFNPIPANLEGKRVVVVDDSIVRGTTTKTLVEMLRKAGAVEIHLRIASAPYRWPCFFGLDTANPGELLAANPAMQTVDDIAAYLGCDSLRYLSADRILEAIDGSGDSYCTACMTGEFPIDVKEQLHEVLQLEDVFHFKQEVRSYWPEETGQHAHPR